jgi:hypothetical protein
MSPAQSLLLLGWVALFAGILAWDPRLTLAAAFLFLAAAFLFLRSLRE